MAVCMMDVQQGFSLSEQQKGNLHLNYSFKGITTIIELPVELYCLLGQFSSYYRHLVDTYVNKFLSISYIYMK